MKNGIFGVLSTALSGLSNVAVQLVVASLVTAAEFGRFALLSSTIVFLIGASRAVIAQTDSLRGLPGHDQQAVNAAYNVASVVSLTGVLIFVTGRAVSEGWMETVGVASALAGVFILQDCVRFRCFRTRRSALALVSDALVLAVATIGLLAVRESTNIAVLAVVVWAAATFLGFAPTALIVKYRPRRHAGPSWLRQHSDLVVPGTVEYMLQAGLPYVVNWIVVSAGGLEALAGYRLIQLIFAAVSNVAQGLNSVTLPRVVDSGSPRMAWQLYKAQALALAVLSTVALATLMLFPAEWGERLFGESWIMLGAFLLPGAVHGTVNALSVPNHSMLRLLGYARYSLIVRLWSVLASVMFVALGVRVAGAPGAAWALALVAVWAYAVRAVKVSVVVRRLKQEGRTIAVRSLPGTA